ncbi:hypothetical protein FOA52_016235 [Chlamydomonas sp. UWO 241]|nr:hypothetical protein FOA52_016235 [Chlamydomonas sp. UWO 241]
MAAISASGVIPVLVRLLIPGSAAHVQQAAAGALSILARGHARNQAAIAGAIPALVQLLLPGSSAGVKAAAALALASLSLNHAQNQAAIATAGAIPALVQLLGPDSSADVQEAAKAALHTLALNHAQNRAAISDAGGVLALRRRQELREEAYYLVLKALMLRDKPDMTLLAQMRMELNIQPDSHKQWTNYLLGQKKAGTLIPNTQGPAQYSQQQQYTPHQQQQQQQQQAFAQPAPRPATTPRHRINPAEAARKAKAQAAAAAAATPTPPGMPEDPLHSKVQFYRKPVGGEGGAGWLEGVVTEYLRLEGKIRVSTLNTKKVELIDYKQSNVLVIHPWERVTDFSNYM